jgi:hypothetical protein
MTTLALFLRVIYCFHPSKKVFFIASHGKRLYWTRRQKTHLYPQSIKLLSSWSEEATCFDSTTFADSLFSLEKWSFLLVLFGPSNLVRGLCTILLTQNFSTNPHLILYLESFCIHSTTMKIQNIAVQRKLIRFLSKTTY